MKTKSVFGAVALSAGLVAGLTMASGTAQADPSGPPTYRQLAGVGSDTTQDVLNGLSDAVTISGTKVIGSYNATGSATITTKDPATLPACQNLTRPNGSSAGRTALVDSLVAGNNCYDFARASALNTAATPTGAGLVYIPFAKEALTYAVANNSGLPKSLTLADVQSLYRCEVPGVNAYIPQPGSGTRAFWLTRMVITEAQLTAGTYPCVKSVAGGNPVQEHDGRVVSGSLDIVPYSVSKFISQKSGAIADVSGNAALGSIDGQDPFIGNEAIPTARDVYNVIPKSKLSTTPWSTTFVGNTSLVCQQPNVIKDFGFLTIGTRCGNTDAQTPNN